MDRLFDDFWRGLEPAAAAGRVAGFAPDVDVEETEREIRVTADLPGVEEQNVTVSIEGDVLTISGERRAEKSREERGHRWTERSHGTFRRAIALPETSDPAKATATFAKGVLTVTVPKTTTAPNTHKIAVQSA